MERIWAPWRMNYILSAAEPAVKPCCIFCELPQAGPEQYQENLILSCGQRVFIILNRYPYNNSHLMIVPRSHVDDPSLLSELDYRCLTELLRRATATLKAVVQPHGINVGMNLGRTAGAGIDEHCHYHLVPRWNGDTKFMPVVAGAKVISEGLNNTFDRLFPHFFDLAPQVEAEIIS